MPIVPAAVNPLVMTGEAGIMVKLTVWLPAVGLAFDALTVALKVPPAVGVPEITPVLVFTFKPGGRPIALNAVGALVAVIVYPPNATPDVPLAVVPLEMTGDGGQAMVTVAVRVVVLVVFAILLPR